MKAEVSVVDGFARSWGVEVLKGAPLIAPVRQFTYPQQIAGEEDALARGALLLMVKPAVGGSFLATCALGFTDPSMPTGVFACPNAEEMCAVAGGYAYVIDTARPEQTDRTTHVGLKPVVEVKVLEAHGLLVFVGFHALVAWGREGLAWETRRLSWEGVRVTGVEGDELVGFGWDLMSDKEVEFRVDVRTGVAVGGAFGG
jgi:hypothetical protein